MMTLDTMLDDRTKPAPAAKPIGVEQLFDPVIRAIMACEGVGREKTIAIVLSAVESAFPR
ncbi:MAG TPA: hypothetical protein VGB82_15335 [Alphaproteobacteria bacterium]|jgi:hypothetical protein